MARVIVGPSNFAAASGGLAATTWESSVTKNDITWTFNTTYEVGRFYGPTGEGSGDYFVIDAGSGVTVSQISPAYNSETEMHGSMINPTPGSSQAYDGEESYFDSELVVTAPVTLNGGDSLISTRSVVTEEKPYTDVVGRQCPTDHRVKSAEILTCLSAIPYADQFRPPYAGTTKTVYRATNFNWSGLPSVTPTSGAPSLSTYARMVERPWLDHVYEWPGRQLHPADNMPTFGMDIGGYVGVAGLLLCCNYTVEQKKPIGIGLVQVGIDNYHCALLHKTLWKINGAHMPGRKFPILFAGKMLENTGMLTLNDYSVCEDDSTYYGSEGHNLWTGWQDNEEYPEYAADVLMMFEDGLDNKGNPWKHEHIHPQYWETDPPFPFNGTAPDYYGWSKPEGYSRMCRLAYPSQGLAAMLMGLKTSWGHDAFFSMCDRWMFEDDEANRAIIYGYWGVGYSPYNGGVVVGGAWPAAMYYEYRDSV